MQALLRETPSGPFGPISVPGHYPVRLTVGGKAMTQSLKLRMDPRVATSLVTRAQVPGAAMNCYNGMLKIRAAQAEIRQARETLIQGATARKPMRSTNNWLRSKANRWAKTFSAAQIVSLAFQALRLVFLP